MNLRETIEKLEPARVLAAPAGDKPVCLILRARDLPRLPALLADNPNLKASRVVIADARGDLEIDGEPPKSLRDAEFLAGFGGLNSIGDADPVFLFMEEWPIRVASMLAPSVAARKIYISESPDPALKPRSPLPDFLVKNAASLERVWSGLYSDKDREVFAARVKSLLTGDPGYLPVAPFREYEHPATAPQKGDAVIDGGLSDMVGAQKTLAEKVGAGGLIYGFEPIPWMAEKAARELRRYPQYRVSALGLSDKKGFAWFADLRDSSRLLPGETQNGTKCELTTIDDFCAENGLERVDLIKLDIEGSELAALKGGERIIAASRPKLHVCLYHNPRDLYEIPSYLMDVLPNYEWRIAHSSCGFTDTILYARPA